MNKQVRLLIIGAGPYGLAMAAYAKSRNIEFIIIGKPMDFWKSNMPVGMFLRSDCDWHMDPLDEHTVNAYLQLKGLKASDTEPIPREFFLEYARWFQEKKDIKVEPALASSVHYVADRFETLLQNGKKIISQCIVVATGFGYFKHVPDEFLRDFPAERFSHTSDLVDIAALNGKRVLIIGGRQSAFEWAALASENGAAAVHISHRHDAPEFKLSDWSWVRPLVETTVARPDWFRKLSQEERDKIFRHFWEEGRLRLEPWLGPRIKTDTIKLWPNSQVTSCAELPSGELQVKMDIGGTLIVDHILLATGYKVQINRLPFLAAGNILEQLATRNGYPELDQHFQSSVPGLFFNSLPATQDFGPFFGFVIGAPAAAKIIGAFMQDRFKVSC